MKISGRREAISQSMDLFIIIAAVLGVGGVVSASVYNLVNSATSNSSITVVGASVKAGSSTSASPVAISISIKNNGGSPITCSPSTCQIVFAGTNTGGTTAPACSAPCSITSGGALTWAIGGPSGPAAANNALTFVAGSQTLQPGAQSSFVLNSALSTLGSSPSPAFWASGAAVTINVIFGSSSAQVVVTSQ